MTGKAASKYLKIYWWKGSSSKEARQKYKMTERKYFSIGENFLPLVFKIIIWGCFENWVLQIWSTVRLRFRKRISGHNFQTIRKLANNDFQYNSQQRDFFVYYTAIHSYKKSIFPHVRNFTLIYGPFSCLNIVLFSPIFMENFVIFYNAAHKLYKNWVDIWKNYKISFFSSSFGQLQLKSHFFPHFLLNKKIYIYIYIFSCH